MQVDRAWIEVIFFAVFALALGLISWWTWSQRQVARQQAEANRQLAALGRQLQGMAHDLAGLWHGVAIQVEQAHTASPDQLPEILDDLQRATLSLEDLIKAFHGPTKVARGQRISFEDSLRLVLSFLGPARSLVDLRLESNLTCAGDQTNAIRLVHNLLSNAVREAAQQKGRVCVVLSSSGLRIENPIPKDASVSERIYEEGESGSGSTGLGLSIATDLAKRLGLSLRHVVQPGQMTFFVELDETATRSDHTDA